MVEAPVDSHDVLVRERVDGEDLGRLLAFRGRPGLPVASVLRWISQAAEALTLIHQNGGVHGDVRPANLVLDRTGQVVLLGPESSSSPPNGPPADAPGFRAPELAAGAAPDRASDVYGLAATTFALVTGTAPGGALPNFAAMSANRASALAPALRSGLAIDPARRPDTPAQFVELLRAGRSEDMPIGVGTLLLVDVMDSQDPTLPGEAELAFDRAVENHDGRSIDADVALFTDAISAVRAAVALQEGGHSSVLRAGLASGDLGDSSSNDVQTLVRLAAAMRDCAGPGEVVLATSTAELVRPDLPADIRLIERGRGGEGSEVADAFAVAAGGVDALRDPSRSPYPGLAPFGSDDAELFVGREAVVEQCLQLLRKERFVALVGASGTGKTSVVIAGLSPRLPAVVTLRPGRSPLKSLEDAGAADQPDAVLVVDQLEDVVTLCPSQAERAAFLDAIVDHPGGLAVTLRADHCSQFDSFGEFAQLLSSGQVPLDRLDGDALSRAVQEPARRCGLVAQDGLAKLVAADLKKAPGGMPMLGHALRETWLRRNGSTLTVAGYRASGGVRSAIADTAERVFTSFDPAGRDVARRLLVRMVQLRPDGDVRRWMSRAEVAAVDPARGPTVLAAFVSAGLVVVDRDQNSVAHEAVLGAWPRLAGWIAEERAVRLDGQRPLAQEPSRVRRLRLLTIASSVVAVVALVAAGIAVAQRNSATRDRDAALLAGLVSDARAAAESDPDTALLLAAEARAESKVPATAGTLVDALLARPSAHTFLRAESATVQAIALDGEAVATASGNQVQLWSQDGWQQTGGFAVGEREVVDLVFTDEGRTLLAAVPGDHALVAVDARTGSPSADPARYGVMQPVRVVTAEDRALVLVENPSLVPRVEQHDLRTLERVGPSLVPPEGRVADVVASTDGQRAALATLSGEVWLADLATGAVLPGAAAPADEEGVGIMALAWHDDLLVAGRLDGTVDAWRADPRGTLTAIGHYDARGRVETVAAGCDGSCLAAGTADGRVAAWRIGSDQVSLEAPRAHIGRVNDLEFTMGGEYVVSAGDDRIMVVHTLDGSLTIAPAVTSAGVAARGAYDGSGGVLRGIDDPGRGRITHFSESGEVTWRTSVGGAVTWLDATENRVVALVAPVAEPMRIVVLSAATGRTLLDESLAAGLATGALSPDGSIAVLATRDGSGSSVSTLDVDTLSSSQPTEVDDEIVAVAFSPDGARIVTGHATGDVALRGLESFAPKVRSEASTNDQVTAVGFTPDGHTVIAGGQAGVVRILDGMTLESRFTLSAGQRRGIAAVAANDQLVLTASDDGIVRMWDLASGAAVGGPIPTGGATAPSIALSSDGARALVPSDRGLLELVLDQGEWVALACTIAGRQLTADERASHGLVEAGGSCGAG
jgi:WD40 repeat protein